MLTLDTLNEGLWDWPDITVPRFWWSHRYYEIMGYAPDELEPTLDTVVRLVHPDDLERLRAQIQANFHLVKPVDLEYRIITKIRGMPMDPGARKGDTKPSGRNLPHAGHRP